jgi:hypothetical protein
LTPLRITVLNAFIEVTIMADNEKQKDDTQPDSKQTRERSKIAFPYGDLDGALEVVKAIYNHGGSAATLDQLVDWMKHENVSSGAFRNKITGAKMFGLTEIDKDAVSLEPLGQQACDPKTEMQARARAFLKVPLYQKIFSTYKGGPLPNDKDLESVMQSFGVPAKQADRARQSFQRSAEQAKVFNEKKDRLVLPAGVSLDSTTPTNGGTSRKVETPIGEQFTGEINPALAALIEQLPPTGEWTRDAHDMWARWFMSTLDKLYKVKE